MNRAIKKIFDLISNFLLKQDVVYIVESKEWSIKWDGHYITKNLKKWYRARTSTTHLGIKNSIIHFGSVSCLIDKKGLKKIHSSNKTVLTWFHVDPDDFRIKYISQLNDKVNLVHTSCIATKDKLIKLGLEKEKIVVIPLGVDLALFKPYTFEAKQKIRKSLGISEDTFVVGSFQKDGREWGDGMEPKMVKGPDIFCDVIAEVSKVQKIHVLLTGPARGYVINRLKKDGVKYTHVYVKKYSDMVDYYNVLDLYLITSREEGGPKALLESWACGVPVVSSGVGMSSDYIKDGKNGFLCNDWNNMSECLCKKILNFLNDRENLERKILFNAKKQLENKTWQAVTEKYYGYIYTKL